MKKKKNFRAPRSVTSNFQTGTHVKPCPPEMGCHMASVPYERRLKLLVPTVVSDLVNCLSGVRHQISPKGV